MQVLIKLSCARGVFLTFLRLKADVRQAIRAYCIFRSIVTPDSGPKWPPGPEQKSRVAKTANAYREDMR